MRESEALAVEEEAEVLGGDGMGDDCCPFSQRWCCWCRWCRWRLGERAQVQLELVVSGFELVVQLTLTG
jgi:hypothetical protein